MKQTIIFGNIITMGEITKQKIFAAILMILSFVGQKLAN